MAKFYLTQIRLGKIGVEDVPERWRSEVEELLEG